MKIWKVVLWIIGAAVGLVVAVYLVVLGINLQDQPPSESVMRLERISASIESIDDDQNAYVFLTGFSIEKCEDPREWGKKRIAWARQLLKQPYDDKYYESPGSDFVTKSYNEPAIVELLNDCREVNRTCLALIENNETRAC